MAEPIAELSIALLGDEASFERMMAKADERLGKFSSQVEATGQRIQASMDRMLGNVSTSAAKMDAALQPVVDAWGDVASAASVAGAEVKAAAGELSSVSGDARKAASALSEVDKAGRAAGAGVNAGMSQTVASVNKGRSALGSFVEMVNRARRSASKPIVQRVTVRRSGEAGGRSGGRGSGVGAELSGYGLITAGTAIVAAEGDMIKQGEAVEDQLRKLYATAGETRDFETLRREVLAISEQFGVLPEDAAKALYPIESLGFRGAQALMVLSAAANMAKGSQTDVAVTGELIAKTLNTYGLGAEKAARLSDIFTRAIKDGNVQGKDFVGAYASVQTMAKNAGLSVEETAAALAVMTHNAKSAAVGGTQLRAFLSGLITPTKAVKDAAKAAGLEWLAAGRGADEIKRVGLSGVLDEIKHATNGNVTALGELLPDMRKNQAAMALLNNGGGVFARTLVDVRHSMGATDSASKEMDKSLGQSSRNMAAAFQVASSNLETALKPILIWIYGKVTQLFNWFNKLPQAVQSVIGVAGAATGALAITIGTTLVLIRWVTALGDIFTRTGAKGVAANAEIAASAEGAAVAEGELAGAAEGAGVATAGAAETGALAFAAGGPFMIAIGLVIVAIGTIAYKWWQVKQAQNDAAKSAQAYYDTLKQNEAAGGLKGLVATQQDIQQGHGGIDRTQDAINLDKENLAKAKANAGMGAGGAGGEGSYGGKTASQWQADLASHEARMTQLKADLASVTAQIKTVAVGGSAHASDGGPVGEAIAKEAWQKQIGLDRVAYDRKCQELARETVQGAGVHAFDKYFAGTAKQSLDNFKKAGLAKKYTPGMLLPAGSLLYSQTMGHDGKKGNEGHVQVIGADGTRYDQHGMNTYKTSNFQYYVPPPGSPGSPNDSTNTNAPSDGGPEPAWAKNLANKAKKGKSVSVGGTSDIPLQHLDALMPENLGRAATNAQTYEEKLRRLNDALAEHGLRLQESGKAYDAFGLKVSEIHQRLTLAQAAIDNTGKASTRLTTKVGAEEAALNASRQAYNADSDRLKAKRTGGGKTDDADAAQHGRLKSAYDDALASYNRDSAALRENARVHAQAVQDKVAGLEALTAAQEENERKQTTRFLKEQQLSLKSGSLNRDQYDGYLQTALAGKNKKLGTLNPDGDDYARIQEALEQSQVARQQAQGRISKDTLTLQKKDFVALKAGMDDEAQAYKDAGVSDADILTWRNLKLHEIDMARNKQQRDDALALGRDMVDLGMETKDELQKQIAQAAASLQADMANAQSPAEAQDYAVQLAKLKLEFSKIDWDAAGQKADGYKAALDTGKLSIEQYIIRLRDLQTTLPATSEEYKRLSADIEAADKQMYDRARRTADAAASQAADGIMAVLNKAKSARQAVRDILKDAVEAGAKKQIEDAVRKLVLHMVVQSDGDKMKRAAEQHEKATDKLGTTVGKMNEVAVSFSNGVDKFGQWVAQFAAAMTQPVGGNGSGAFGSGASTDGGNFGQNAKNDGGAFGGTASQAVAPAPAPALNAQAKGNTAKSVSSATNDINAGMQVAEVAKNGVGSGIGAVSTAASLAGNIASVSKWASVGSALSAAAPYIGLVTTALALFGMFGSHKKTPTSTQSQNYANVLSSFSPTIDSGYSGSDGLRTLLGPTTRQAAGVSSAGQVPAGHTFNFNIAAGAFNGLADPVAHGTQLVQTVVDKMADIDRLSNASRGEG